MYLCHCLFFCSHTEVENSTLKFHVENLETFGYILKLKDCFFFLGDCMAEPWALVQGSKICPFGDLSY